MKKIKKTGPEKLPARTMLLILKKTVSLKSFAETSDRRKSSPFNSAMSMLNFYINRAGKNLAPTRKEILEEVKKELMSVISESCDKDGLK